MLDYFFLFNGLAACSTSDGLTVIFSPYNLSVGIMDNRLDSANVISACDRLGCFGLPSEGGPSQPDNFDLTLLITNDCNLRCKYCFADGGEKKDYMTSDMAVGIIEKVFRTTDRQNIKISFFGGEPTLNFRVIRDAVEAVKSLSAKEGKDYFFYITTNGLISLEKLDYLVDNGFTFVISSDGAPEIHDYLRPGVGGRPSGREVEKTIKRLVKKEVPFKVRSTVSAFNVNSMADTVRYFSEAGVRTVHFEPVTRAGRGRSDEENMQRPTDGGYLLNFKLAFEAAKESDVSVISSSYMNFLAPSHKFCDAMAGSRLVGSYNGDITCCVEVQDSCHPYSGKAIIGRLTPRAAAIDFDAEKYERLLDGSGADRIEGCKKCFAKYCCGGGCPVKNFYSTGCERVDMYRCSITKELVKHVLNRIYEETMEAGEALCRTDILALYRMKVPGEIWMKRKRAKISNVLAELIVGNEFL